MTYQLIRGDATALPLADDSVDLIATSPPYFALRSYTDGGEHYDGQIGSEATPQAFLEALWAWTRECVRVMKPTASMWVNLGDKYAGSGGGGEGSIDGTTGRGPRPARRACAIPAKSLMGLPWRYAIGCIDRLGLILRAEIIWSKPNGLPESVTDRVRRSHEQWFHFTKEPRYFSAVDEVREQYSERVMDRQRYAGRDVPPSQWSQTIPSARANNDERVGRSAGILGFAKDGANPLGKLPGSVWEIPTEPLRLPDHLPQHFAAFPSEWPRRLILGWTPSGICVECGQGRRPVVERDAEEPSEKERARLARIQRERAAMSGGVDAVTLGRRGVTATITGYACACPDTTAPTTPAVVLDPFAGTGTTPAVAHALGRHGIGIDLSADYLRLAEWRCNDPALRAKVLGVDKPKPVPDGQGSLFGDAA